MTLSKAKAAARKAQTAQVMANRKAQGERRARIASEFRTKLLDELKIIGEPTASQSALILACVSAYVEISELNDRFLRGYTTPKARTELGLSRGQLQRGLRALKLITEDEPDDPRPNVASIIAGIEARRTNGGAA